MFINKFFSFEEKGVFLLFQFVEFGSELFNVGLIEELFGGFRDFGLQGDLFSVPIELRSVSSFGSFSFGFLLFVVWVFFGVAVLMFVIGFGFFIFGRLFLGLFLFGLRFEFFLVLGLFSDGFCWVNKSLFDVLLGDEPWHMDCKRKRIIKRG